MENEVSKQKEGTKRTLWIRVLILLLVGGSFWAGIHVGYTQSRYAESLAILTDTSSLPPEGVDLFPLWKAWNVLEEKFVSVATTTTALTDEELIWGAIGGLADAYGDPYTVFFPPVESSIFEEDINGSFGGVGMEVGIRDDRLTVIAPLKDTPAERAGIQSGDLILEIDGVRTDSLSIDEAVQKIRGEVGTTVTLTIGRKEAKELKTIVVLREIIIIPTIDTEFRSDGVFVISLYNFSAQSPNLFRMALREFIDSSSDKLIIDLRNNPGGFLEASIDITSWFLPAGKIIVTEDFGQKRETQIHRSKGFNIFTDRLSVVVLINKGSASASEITAGALQEHGIATLIGENTFGKGSVQEVVKITPDTSLKITIARWLTPKGISISDGGLAPDIQVPVTEEDIKAGRDPQLIRAVEFLLKK